MINSIIVPARLFNRTSGSDLWAIGRLLRWSLLLLLATSLSSCGREGKLVEQSQYETALVGGWQGTVGEEQETITFRADGRFTAQLLKMGFISNTLGEGTVGTIQGTWMLRGNVLSLSIETIENVQTLNMAATSTIVAFNQNELVVNSTGGGTSFFSRVMGFK